MQLRSDLIGGGQVRRAFQLGQQRIAAGVRLTGDQIRAMRNHQALIEGGRIDVWPVTNELTAAPGGKRFVIHRGRGKYDVIEGRQLNDEPLTKEEADALLAPAH